MRGSQKQFPIRVQPTLKTVPSPYHQAYPIDLQHDPHNAVMLPPLHQFVLDHLGDGARDGREGSFTGGPRGPSIESLPRQYRFSIMDPRIIYFSGPPDLPTSQLTTSLYHLSFCLG